MTTTEALRKLKSIQLKEKKLRDERIKLTAFLLKNRVDLDGSKSRKKRNQRMYRLYKKGIKSAEIAKVFNLSPGRILTICKRLDIQERNKTK